MRYERRTPKRKRPADVPGLCRGEVRVSLEKASAHLFDVARCAVHAGFTRAHQLRECAFHFGRLCRADRDSRTLGKQSQQWGVGEDIGDRIDTRICCRAGQQVRRLVGRKRGSLQLETRSRSSVVR